MRKSPFRCILTASVLAASVLCLASPVLAEEALERPPLNDYAYEFEDDALLGDIAAARGTVLQVRRFKGRTLLLRPRVQFVSELLDSIEQL